MATSKQLMTKTRGWLLGWPHVICIVGFAVLAFLLFADLLPLQWISLFSAMPPGVRGPVLGTYAIGVLIAHLFIHTNVWWMRRAFAGGTLPGLDPRFYWPPVILGACESVLYSGAILIQKPEFIAVWLGVKVAGSWSLWGEKDHESRNRWQVFLIGNALSIGFGFLLARAVQVVRGY